MKTYALALAAALALAGCNSSNKPENAEATPKPAEKPAVELQTGRTALQRMAMPAHMWAADVQPVRLESQPTKASNGADGKAGVWRSTWASTSKGSAKDFTWSGVTEDDAPSPGFTPGGESSWNPGNTSMQAWDLGFLKTDTDKALATAKAKLTGKAKNATPVRYTLAFDGRKSQLLWRVSFANGERATTVDVDATSGNYVRTEN